jgi:hypothetical protein
MVFLKISLINDSLRSLRRGEKGLIFIPFGQEGLSLLGFRGGAMLGGIMAS